MDTRLKNYRRRPVLLGAGMTAESLLAVGLLIAGSIFSAMSTMVWVDEETRSGIDDGYFWYKGVISDQKKFDWLQNLTGIGFVIGAAIFTALLVFLIVLAGRGCRDEEGKPQLTWFDKIWSEAQIAVAVLSIIWIVDTVRGCYEIWMGGQWLGIWENMGDQLYNSGMLTPQIEMTYGLTVLLVNCFVTLACFLSLVKKIKLSQFWEKSLLGGAFLAIYRSIKGSDKTLVKVLVVLMAGAFLSAVWILLPVVLVLILVFVPKMVKKFAAIKTGVEEVKNGNLTYKIPVEKDAKGVMGEFDRLAADINDISQASNIAIQNELKTQRMKTDLISNVSHDLKTPLTSMISYIDLLKQEGLDSPNAPEYLEIIDQKTQRLKVLTENLFEAAKASSGAIPVNLEPIDLSSLLTQTLAELEEKLSAKELDIQIHCACDEARIMADGNLMWRVLENLFGNISKYAMPKSRVYVEVRNVEPKNNSAEPMILLEIKNISQDPLNIPAEELMERFKRGDESRNTEGSGLGLAIAKDLVKLMEGIFEISIDGDLFKAAVMMKKAEN